MPRWNGGVIGAANNPTSSSAKGIWSLSEATKAIRAGLWPPSNAGADPYFENVTLLLPGDGTNGAQNNTFLDSSTNNFTITRNGNTTQGTFTPFSKADGRWGVYFDGSGDYISVPRSTNFLPGANTDFTFEVWIFPTATPAGATNVVGLGEFGTNADWHLGVNSSLQLTLYLQSTTTTYTNSTQALTLNQWNHIAASRSGTGSNNLKLFVNGVGQSFSTNASTVGTGTNDLTIAADNAGDEGNITGFLSNLRIVNGQGLYTANFTPATSPFTTTSEGATSTNVELLALQSSRFIDNSSNSATLSAFGNTAATTFSPFPTLTAYAAGTNGGSAYFDGTGDYLTVANNTALNLESGDFTVECWFYAVDTTSAKPLIVRFNGNTTARTDLQYYIRINAGSLDIIPYQSTTDYAMSFSNLTANAWHHCALVRTGNNFYAYLDGVRNATTRTITGSLNNNTWETWVGGYREGGTFSYQNGYISSVRVVKGTALYTEATYTVPTTPFTAITNTSLLLSGTNGGIVDAAMSNDLETVGNAQISTTQSKFGGASMYFDGNDKVTLPYTQNFSLGTTYTIEGWVYPTTVSGYQRIFDIVNSATSSPAFLDVALNGTALVSEIRTTNGGGVTTISGGTVSANTWAHFALSVSAGSAKLFLNGTQVGSTTTFSALPDQNFVGIGGIGNSLTIDYLTGYIDDLRISKGLARYTANFTAPSGPFIGFGD